MEANITEIINQAVENALNPIREQVENATKLVKEQTENLKAQAEPQEPEIPHDVWERAVRKAFGENYKIY